MIHWRNEGGVILAVLDRPERHNSLDVETVRALTARLRADAGPARPLVISGVGPTFCSGFDLAGGADGAAFRAGADSLLDSLAAYPAPVIAALNGPAVGMGCLLAAACDIRIGCERSWLEIPAARLGAVLPDAYVAHVRDRLGLAAAQQLLVASRRIEARRAYEIGLLHGVVEEPLAEAVAWGVHVASFDPVPVARHKVFVNGSVSGPGGRSTGRAAGGLPA